MIWFMQDYSPYLKFAISLAETAGVIIETGWYGTFQTFEKGSGGDLVTEIDIAAEKAIFDRVRSTYPDHGTYGEESGGGSPLKEGFVWVVDPVDGTTNFSHRFPFVAVSIGLLYNGVPVVGVVYNPILKEIFTAIKGGGTLFQGKQVHVSTIQHLPRSLLATGFAYDRRETNDNNYREFCHMTQVSQGVRRAGSAALDLAGVAVGRFDGYWERGLKPWDIAAGILLVEEAGGKITSYEGGPLVLESGRILASNGLIHDQMIKELKL
jgi:myo-inositol-1(or 4)-monophosphatase